MSIKDLDRFENFIDAEFRTIKIINPTNILLEFAVQDKARGFDWITLKLEFFGVSDAKLLDDSKLSFIDMSDGATLLFKDGLVAFAIGKYSNFNSIKDSIFYIIADNFKTYESNF